MMTVQVTTYVQSLNPPGSEQGPSWLPVRKGRDQLLESSHSAMAGGTVAWALPLT
jgi:hypothetical protein